MKSAGVSRRDGRVWLIGADGLIGGGLKNRLGSTDLITTTRKSIQGLKTEVWDLINPAPEFSFGKSDTVVLAAAVTSVEGCEKDPAKARRVNVDAPAELADLCARRGARLVFLSSSAVFDGMKPFPVEADVPCPVNEYGRTKLAAEKKIQDSGAKHLILRLTKVLNPAEGYLAGLLRALAQGERVMASPDLPVAPLSLPWAVEAITRCLDCRESGIMHLSPKNETHYFDLAEKVAAKHGFNLSLIKKQPLAELRKRIPHISRHAALAAVKAATQLGLSVPPWEEALN